MLDLKKIKTKLTTWWKYDRPFCKTWNEYFNPLYHWWKVRKYFKRPKAHFVKGRFGGHFGLPCRLDCYHYGPNFFMRALGWKDKWNTPRHEWDPIICIVWRNPWKTWIPNKFSKETNSKGEPGFYTHNEYWIGWIFNWVKEDWRDESYTSSMATWEAILDMLYYDRAKEWCQNNHRWLSGIGENEHKITIDDNLK